MRHFISRLIGLFVEVLHPVNQTLTVGAVDDLMAALQFNERLGGDHDPATGTNSGGHGHNHGMGQTAADELIAIKDRTRHSGTCFGTHLGQLIQALTRLILPRFKADLLSFQFGLEVGPYSVNFLQCVVLMQFSSNKAARSSSRERFTFSIIVHLPSHGLIFPGSLDTCPSFLFLLLFDAGAVVIEFAGNYAFPVPSSAQAFPVPARAAYLSAAKRFLSSSNSFGACSSSISTEWMASSTR